MSKEIVRIRQKALRDGSISLYLDIYKDGHRSYKFLKLYLVPEKTRADKQANKETMRIAEAAKAQVIIDIERNNFGLSTDSGKTLLDLFDEEIERKIAKGMKVGTLGAMRKRAEACLGAIRLSALTLDRALDLKESLEEEKIGQNTKNRYFTCFKRLLREAAKRNLIKSDILMNIGSVDTEETSRLYLTIEELKKLAATPCKWKELRRAYLFSCLTGLRGIDIFALKWSNVETSPEGYTRLIFRQIKTGGQEYLDVTEQAAELLGERGDSGEHIFRRIVRNTTKVSERLQEWARAAGINKAITFHSARHTFATMMLTLDVNISVIQKLLGHRDISTTQIYAKVLDRSKQSAVDLIPKIF